MSNMRQGCLSEDELIVLFGSPVQAAAHLVSEVHAGSERAAAIASAAFLSGTARPGDTPKCPLN
jgi:hypothetical protein